MTGGKRPRFRRLLMLQGPVGPFFWLLARRLRKSGVRVHKINLNAGDALLFPGPATHAYRGSRADWPEWLRAFLVAHDIDAIALFGDCRPMHRQAIALAEECGVPVFVFEEGYLRPDHITVELGGVNGHSQLAWQWPAQMPAAVDHNKTVPVGNSFPGLALWSLLYSAARDAGRLFYPHYRHHRGDCITEGLAYLRSFLRKLRHRRRDRQLIEAVIRSGRPWFLLPLQVHFDSQLTVHSPFLSVEHQLVETIRSFGADAPADSLLVVKHHPIDRGHRCYRDAIEEAAQDAGCPGRVLYILEGHLPTLLEGAAGTITCNSTVGLSSLWHGTPVKALGQAVYNRPGLSAQGPLSGFWAAPPPVDRAAVSHFIGFLKATCLANGSFYTGYRQTGLPDKTVARMQAQYAGAAPRHSLAPVATMRKTEDRERARAVEFPGREALRSGGQPAE
jgi:capsule polysaccharide modification protein KpsS